MVTEAVIETDIDLNDANLAIYNSQGQLVSQMKNIYGSKITLQRGDLSKGIYYIKLTEENSVIATEKLSIRD